VGFFRIRVVGRGTQMDMAKRQAVAGESTVFVFLSSI